MRCTVALQSEACGRFVFQARRLAAQLAFARQSLNVPQLQKTFTVVDGGQFIIIIKALPTITKIIILGSPAGNFTCQPRVDGIDGWSDLLHQSPQGDGLQPFPLVDDDGLSVALEYELETGDWATDNSLQAYGNIDWKGPLLVDTESNPLPDQTERLVLTWKGPPSRYFPLNPVVSYPGFTELDTFIAGVMSDVVYYTPFSPLVYQHGEVLAAGPPVNFPQSDFEYDHRGQILGAAIATDNALLVMVKACYTTKPEWWTVDTISPPDQPPYGIYDTEVTADAALMEAQANYPDYDFAVTHHDRPGAGYWYEAYRTNGRPSGTFRTLDNPGGWELLGRMAADERPKVPWFWNASATEAATVEGGTVFAFNIGAGFSRQDAGYMGRWDSDGSYSETTMADTVDVPADGGFGTISPGVHAKSYYAYDLYSTDYGTYIVPYDEKRLNGHSKQGGLTITKSGTRVVAVDFKGDVLVTATAVMSGSSVSSLDYKDYRNIMGVVKWAQDGEPADHIPSGWIDYQYQDINMVKVGDRFLAVLFQMCRPDVSYSSSCGQLDDDGYVTSLATCCKPCNMTIVVDVIASSKEGVLNLQSTQDDVPPQGTWKSSSSALPSDPSGYSTGVWLYPLQAGGYSTSNTDCADKRFKIVSVASSSNWYGVSRCGGGVAPAEGWNSFTFTKYVSWGGSGCGGYPTGGFYPYPKTYCELTVNGQTGVDWRSAPPDAVIGGCEGCGGSAVQIYKGYGAGGDCAHACGNPLGDGALSEFGGIGCYLWYPVYKKVNFTNYVCEAEAYSCP